VGKPTGRSVADDLNSHPPDEPSRDGSVPAAGWQSLPPPTRTCAAAWPSAAQLIGLVLNVPVADALAPASLLELIR